MRIRTKHKSSASFGFITKQQFIAVRSFCYVVAKEARSDLNEKRWKKFDEVGRPSENHDKKKKSICRGLYPQ